MNIDEARKKWPMYSDLTDMQLADSIGRKYYPDMPVSEVANRLGMQEKAAPIENTSGFVDAAKSNVKNLITDPIKAVKANIASNKGMIGELVEDGKEIYENMNINPFSFEMSPMVGGGYGNEAPGYVPPPKNTGAWAGKSLPAEALKVATGKTDYNIEQHQLDFADRMVRVHEKSGDTESPEYRGWLKMSSDIRSDRKSRDEAEFSWETIKQGFEANPNIMVAELFNALWSDFYLMTTPLAYEKAAAVTMARTAKYGATVAKASSVAAGTTSAAVTGAALIAPISIFEQLNENDTVNESRVAKEMEFAALLSGGLGLVLGAPGTVGGPTSRAAGKIPDIAGKASSRTFRQGEKTLLLGDGNLPAPTPARIEAPVTGRVIDVDAGGNARMVTNNDPATNALERSADRVMAQSSQDTKALPAPEGREIIAPHERWGLEGKRIRRRWGLDVEARAVRPAEGVEIAQARITEAEAKAAEAQFQKTRVPSNLAEEELAIRQAVSETLMEPEKTVISRISMEDKRWLRKNFAGKNDEERLRYARDVYGKQGGKIDFDTAAWLAVGMVAGGIGAAISDDKIMGAVVGVGTGLTAVAAARVLPKVARAAWKASKEVPDTKIRVDHFMDDADTMLMRGKRESWAFNQHVKAIVKDPARRVAMTHGTENPNIKVSPEERAVMQQGSMLMANAHKMAKEYGVIEGHLENFMPHMWVTRGKSGSEILDIIREQRRGAGKSPHTMHNKPRLLDLYQDGLDAGLTPVTLDYPDLVKLYLDSVTRAVSNKKLIMALQKAKSTEGTPLIMDTNVNVMDDILRRRKSFERESADRAGMSEMEREMTPRKTSLHPQEGKVVAPPKDYVHLDHPQFRGKAVHPDIAPSLQFTFDASNPSAFMQGLYAVNFVMKRSKVQLSFFHLNALLESSIFAGVAYGLSDEKNAKTAMAAGGLIAFGRRAGRAAARSGKFVKDMTPTAAGAAIGGAVAGAPGAVAGGIVGYLGKQLYHAVDVIRGKAKINGKEWRDLLRSGGIGDEIDESYVAGLTTGATEDAGVDMFYAAMNDMQRFADEALPGSGKAVEGLKKLNKLNDYIMWDSYMTGIKLIAFTQQMEVALLRNAKLHQRNPAKYPIRSREAIGKDVAEYVNDAFGGLNWRRIAEKTRTAIGRSAKLEAFKAGNRKKMQLGIFAPDWTLASQRVAIKAIPGVASSREIGAMHRAYMLRSAIYWATIANGLNYLYSGHFIWENEPKDADPNDSPRQASLKKLAAVSHVDMGDGRRMVASKQMAEPLQWASDPYKTGLSKMGGLPATLGQIVLNKQWLSPGGHAPPVWTDEESPFTKIPLHVAKAFTPIAGGQFLDQGAEGIYGLAGHPIYGTSDEEKERRKEERKSNRKSSR